MVRTDVVSTIDMLWVRSVAPSFSTNRISAFRIETDSVNAVWINNAHIMSMLRSLPTIILISFGCSYCSFFYRNDFGPSVLREWHAWMNGCWSLLLEIKKFSLSVDFVDQKTMYSSPSGGYLISKLSWRWVETAFYSEMDSLVVWLFD